jgi:hypothetical protein
VGPGLWTYLHTAKYRQCKQLPQLCIALPSYVAAADPPYQCPLLAAPDDKLERQNALMMLYSKAS